MRVWGVGLVAILAACSGGGSSNNGGGPGAGDGPGAPSAPGDGAGTSGAGASTSGGPATGGDACPAGVSICADHATVHACVAGAWQDTVCPAGSGCFQGACTPNACSDECTLGQASGGKTCVELDLATGATSTTGAPVTSTHDRARAYETWLRRDGMAAGSVGDARYADPPTYKTLSSVTDLGDSAIWTGTYLASEALRLE